MHLLPLFLHPPVLERWSWRREKRHCHRLWGKRVSLSSQTRGFSLLWGSQIHYITLYNDAGWGNIFSLTRLRVTDFLQKNPPSEGILRDECYQFSVSISDGETQKDMTCFVLRGRIEVAIVYDYETPSSPSDKQSQACLKIKMWNPFGDLWVLIFSYAKDGFLKSHYYARPIPTNISLSFTIKYTGSGQPGLSYNGPDSPLGPAFNNTFIPRQFLFSNNSVPKIKFRYIGEKDVYMAVSKQIDPNNPLSPIIIEDSKVGTDCYHHTTETPCYPYAKPSEYVGPLDVTTFDPWTDFADRFQHDYILEFVTNAPDSWQNFEMFTTHDEYGTAYVEWDKTNTPAVVKKKLNYSRPFDTDWRF